MSKIVPLLIGGTGVAAASCGGVLLIKNSKSSTTESPTTTAQTATEPQLIFDTVDAFTSKMSESACVKDTFGEGVTFEAGAAQEIQTSSLGTSEFFKTNPSSSTIKSCVLINWKKTASSAEGNSKGTGKFTWLWTFMKGDEGFINFNVAEPTGEEGQLKFTGIFYLVSKKANANKTWEAKYKKLIQDSDNKTDKDKLEEHLPLANETLKESVGGEYGGFTDSKDKFSSFCQSGDSCPGTPASTSIQQLQWTAATGGADSGSPFLKDGAKNLTWWDKIYGINDQWGLESKIGAIKGTGTKKTTP